MLSQRPRGHSRTCSNVAENRTVALVDVTIRNTNGDGVLKGQVKMRICSKFTASLFATLVVLTLLTGCGSKAAIDPVHAVTISTTKHWKSETAKFEKKINGFEFPTFQSDSKPQIAEFLNTKVGALLSQYFDPIQQDSSQLGDQPEFDLKGEFVTSFGNYVTYKISGYSFSGGAAHGSPIDEYYVLDYDKQAQVFISHFIPKLSNATISSIIYRQLRFSLGLDSANTDLIPGNLSEISSELQWWPETEGIHFFFPVYSVASYADGPQEGFISWVDIRDEYPNSKNATYAEIASFVTDPALSYYLHIDESSGTFIEVTKVENGTDASTIGFWWASEGTYYYKGKVGNQAVKYTMNYLSGKSGQFTYELLSKYPLTFNRDSKNRLRVVGPMSDLKFIDFLLNKSSGPTATDLFLDAEKAGWMTDDHTGEQ